MSEQKYKLVPIKPTDEMKRAGERERLSYPGNINPIHTWIAMINASPAVEAEPCSRCYDMAVRLQRVDTKQFNDIADLNKKLAETERQRDELEIDNRRLTDKCLDWLNGWNKDQATIAQQAEKIDELEERNAELEATIGRWDHAFKLSALEGEVKRQAEEIALLKEHERQCVENISEFRLDSSRLNILDMPGIEVGIDIDPGVEKCIVIYRVSGNRNDREWTELGRGTNIRAALDNAAIKASKEAQS